MKHILRFFLDKITVCIKKKNRKKVSSCCLTCCYLLFIVVRGVETMCQSLRAGASPEPAGTGGG